jgi:hypothetical protein
VGEAGSGPVEGVVIVESANEEWREQRAVVGEDLSSAKVNLLLLSLRKSGTVDEREGSLV